jgi:hypothetical protein
VVVGLVVAVAEVLAEVTLVAGSAEPPTSQVAVLMRRTLVLEAQSTVEVESVLPCPAGQLKSRTLRPVEHKFVRMSHRDHPWSGVRVDVRLETYRPWTVAIDRRTVKVVVRP